MSQEAFPNPGPSYSIVERIGGGKHKTAYRATASNRATDVCLLYAKGGDGTEDLSALRNDMHALMKISRSHPGYRHIAEFIALTHGDDGRPFIVEEFLSRPLSKLSPLDDIRRIAEISRDLSSGLACIHAAGLAHRDIKLDNCGVDSHGRAKLFDLGSLTSDFDHIRGNIYTRAPELLLSGHSSEELQSTWQASDVWALGATIFALRVGEYPFITRSEFEHREKLSRADQMTPEQAEAAKQEFERRITEKFEDEGLEQKLVVRIERHFTGGAEKIIKSMLLFDDRRPSAESCQERWSEVCVESAGFDIVRPIQGSGKIEILSSLIDSAERAEMHLTYNHCERLIEELERVRAGVEGSEETARLQTMIERMKQMKIDLSSRRLPAFAER